MQWVNHDDEFWKLDHELGGYASICFEAGVDVQHVLRVFNRNIECIYVSRYLTSDRAKTIGKKRLFNSVTALDYMEDICNGQRTLRVTTGRWTASLVAGQQ